MRSGEQKAVRCNECFSGKEQVTKTGGKEQPMNYLTVREAAQKWNVSQRLVQRYCAQGRIDGAKNWGHPG